MRFAGCLLCCLVFSFSASAEPSVVTATLDELWRAGGEDDEVFFGAVAGVQLDSEGNILLLDGQLSEVHVFAPDGQLLRTVGRAGEGPGEVTRPGGMFLDPDGRICLLQGMPGRVVRLYPDGSPADVATYAETADAQTNFAVLNGGFFHPSGMVLVGIRMTFDQTPVSKQNFFLALCDQNGLQRVALFEKECVINYADFVIAEGGMDFVWSRFTVDRQGLVYAAPERNGYLINVYGPNGAVLRTLSRDYEPLVRNEEQKTIARQIWTAVGAYYPVPPRRVDIEETEPDIAGMWVSDAGELWVQTSRGNYNPPAGSWCLLDVFAPDGGFDRQVALPGAHDARQDALFLLPGDLMVVVTGALEAFLNQQAVTSDNGGEKKQEGSPLEVICYRMNF